MGVTFGVRHAFKLANPNQARENSHRRVFEKELSGRGLSSSRPNWVRSARPFHPFSCCFICLPFSPEMVLSQPPVLVQMFPHQVPKLMPDDPVKRPQEDRVSVKIVLGVWLGRGCRCPTADDPLLKM